MVDHLALPIAINTTGRLAAVPQDSNADVAQSVALLLSTRPGERLATPDYGLDDPLGIGVDVGMVADVIGKFEERADPASVELTDAGPVVQTVSIRRADQEV